MSELVSRATLDRAIAIATVALDSVDVLNVALMRVAAAAGATVPADQLAVATGAVRDYRQELALLAHASRRVAGESVH